MRAKDRSLPKVAIQNRELGPGFQSTGKYSQAEGLPIPRGENTLDLLLLTLEGVFGWRPSPTFSWAGEVDQVRRYLCRAGRRWGNQAQYRQAQHLDTGLVLWARV